MESANGLHAEMAQHNGNLSVPSVPDRLRFVLQTIQRGSPNGQRLAQPDFNVAQDSHRDNLDIDRRTD